MNTQEQNTNRLKVVLDTNILLVSFPKQSKYRPIFEALLAGKYDLIICNELIYEYYEIILRKITSEIAKNLISLLLTLPNVYKRDIYYKWRLITIDYDDNKFVDCAISGQADFIVTEDKHLRVLKTIDFPKVNIIGIDEFLEIVEKM